MGAWMSQGPWMWEGGKGRKVPTIITVNKILKRKNLTRTEHKRGSLHLSIAYIYTHVHEFVCVFYFRFFSIIGYCKIMTMTPWAIHTQATINFVLTFNDGL